MARWWRFSPIQALGLYPICLRKYRCIVRPETPNFFARAETDQFASCARTLQSWTLFNLGFMPYIQDNLESNKKRKRRTPLVMTSNNSVDVTTRRI